MSPFRPASNASQTGGLTSRQLEQARKVEADNALAVHSFRHGAHARTQIGIANIEMLVEINDVGATCEMELVDRLLERAAGSPVKLAIAGRAVQRASIMVDRSIMRDFGMLP